MVTMDHWIADRSVVSVPRTMSDPLRLHRFTYNDQMEEWRRGVFLGVSHAECKPQIPPPKKIFGDLHALTYELNSNKKFVMMIKLDERNFFLQSRPPAALAVAKKNCKRSAVANFLFTVPMVIS